MTKRPGRKSIIASFGSFAVPPASQSDADECRDGQGQAPSAVEDRRTESPPDANPLAERRAGRVGAGVIGVTQRTLTDLREERDRLQSLVDSSGSIAIDPSLIDPSPFKDRLPDDTDADFERFRKLLSDEGQKVPIQVRPHPKDQGRYQVIYGHRRWRAAKDLGIKVKATILSLDDGELAVAQGIENAARQDLSWIERAVFAGQMDGAGVRPRDIKAALSIDDAELARLRMVLRVVPVEMIRLIGRAPKIGRPRWQELARALDTDRYALPRLRKTLSADKVSKLSSDERFRHALATVKVPAKPELRPVDLTDPSGKVVGKASIADGEVTLTVAKELAEPFRAFMEQEVPDLMTRFFDRNRDE
ncbi:plasmid partitioning protein RepB [Jiella mangrovi]|uniref:Plasmid partitioning protein RepB n=1 Tax=Jiella mangrovi TaxID=2821407 RepID=A0ABS4BNU0_9HYPH|nr:plasmid partitioning protein RepB [Jiella mangrovi]MBP0617795.1 plasmid partitioning protein RepB [Jiella mangrovi]